MSLEMANKFIEKVKGDSAMQEDLKGVVLGLFDGKGDPLQEVITFAKTKGYDFIKDELTQALNGKDLTSLISGSGLDKLLGEGGLASLMDKFGGMFKA